MRAVCSSYVTYFNNKYGRVGALFQGNFKAKRVDRDEYLLYLTRYIHRNPADFLSYKWSSLDYWLNNKTADWMCAQKPGDMTAGEYLQFIKDDADYELADEKIVDLKF